MLSYFYASDDTFIIIDLLNLYEVRSVAINIQILQRDGYDVVNFDGDIDAEAEVHLGQLLTKIGNKLSSTSNQYQASILVVLEVGLTLRELEAKSPEILFEHCTPEVVMQINMIPSFKGSAKVSSVYGNFICDECGEEKEELFTEGANLPSGENIELDTISCPNCGAEMELEEMEDEFFAFLAAS